SRSLRASLAGSIGRGLAMAGGALSSGNGRMIGPMPAPALGRSEYFLTSPGPALYSPPVAVSRMTMLAPSTLATTKRPGMNGMYGTGAGPGTGTGCASSPPTSPAPTARPSAPAINHVLRAIGLSFHLPIDPRPPGGRAAPRSGPERLRTARGSAGRRNRRAAAG